MLEEQVTQIDRKLRSMDGELPEQVRVIWGLQRIVTYLRGAERQYDRLNDSLYGRSQRPASAPRFPIDQGAALCEAHFLFICWDSIKKVLENLARNSYGFSAPQRIIEQYGTELRSYAKARNHLEHLPERFPGQDRTDWEGDANSITGSTAGISRNGAFVFQGETWDVSDQCIARLRTLVEGFVTKIHDETDERMAGFLRGESAIRSPQRG